MFIIFIMLFPWCVGMFTILGTIIK
jgi:hypothetical protein